MSSPSLSITVIFLLASLVGSNSPLELITSLNNIIPGMTNEVTLNCFQDTQNISVLAPVHELITRIRLLKLDKQTSQWNRLAQIIHPRVSTVRFFNQSEAGDVLLDGYLGNQTTTFLKVTWPTPTLSTVGSYKCEMDGYLKGDGSYSSIQSSVVNIENNPLTVNELLDIIVQMKKDFQARIVDSYFELRYWPTGNYSLLVPETGCPDTTSSTLKPGSISFQTDTHEKPAHVFSNPSHLGKNFLSRFGTRNIIKFNFCSSDRTEPRLLWPKGSYCIQELGYGSLPDGFTMGMITLVPKQFTGIIETVDNVNVNVSVTAGAFRKFEKNSFIIKHYGCRNDGDADKTIRLPTEKPFYLYRYKGKCQEVFDMDVTNEWMEFEIDQAKINANKEFAPYLILGSHPDITTSTSGQSNWTRIELCYYTKTLR